MNILIAGGSGFIGSHLTKHYLKNNQKVTVIDNFITGNKLNLKEVAKNKNLNIIEADITQYNFSKLNKFDIIFDLASPASPYSFKKLSLEIIKVNSIGLINLLNFFVKSKGGCFVFSSTSEVYGDPTVNPQPENYLGNVNSYGERACYDEGKRFAEAILYSYIQKYDCDIRIARIFNTYGPFMDKNDGRVISNFVNQALLNKPITVYGDGLQTRSCCYVSDMVKGLTLLGEKCNLKGQVINIGNPDERKIINIAKLIKKLTNSSSKIIFKTIGKDDPKKRQPDISKAKKLLNWSPLVSLEDGLQLTINYFKNNQS